MDWVDLAFIAYLIYENYKAEKEGTSMVRLIVGDEQLACTV